MCSAPHRAMTACGIVSRLFCRLVSPAVLGTSDLALLPLPNPVGWMRPRRGTAQRLPTTVGVTASTRQRRIDGHSLGFLLSHPPAQQEAHACSESMCAIRGDVHASRMQNMCMRAACRTYSISTETAARGMYGDALGHRTEPPGR